MFIPTTAKEITQRGWTQLDVIFFSGDAYIDHPAFGVAILARLLESKGLKVAVVPQPNWRDDLRDFKKLGEPRLFFAVCSGCMDSMVNHYTAGKRLRSNDAYTPEGRAGYRPDRATTVYTRILKQLFPNTPVVIGGIEASLRRIAHYDYWEDCLMPGLLATCPADLLIYGMGEKPLSALVDRLLKGEAFNSIKNLPQTAWLSEDKYQTDIQLASFETCQRSKRAQADNFALFETQSNLYAPTATMGQDTAGKTIVINPPYPPLSTEELDAIYALPFTRQPHPRYKGKTIPAFEMIKYSVTIHRGCFGGCAFCTISAHQGKYIASRSVDSILNEVQQITKDPDFKGYISDLGGPSANMYGLHGKDMALCSKCKRPSCLHPSICPNLNNNHNPLIALYQKASALPGIKKICIGSGIRYDLATQSYLKEVILNHVSGRLKVAPEHTEDSVLKLMRKPSFEHFKAFEAEFEKINREAGLKQQLIPYFISSHPGCTIADMASLAVKTKQMRFQLEQVQDFTPTPLTLATEIYYTGIHPYTKEKVYTARKSDEKIAQRSFFFWYKNEYKSTIIKSLKEHGLFSFIDKIYGHIKR